MEKIDLVYILGNGSRWSDNEIRFSLRSVEKYFNYRHIFIIGEKPEWMTGVIHIKADDSERNKLLNARKKYMIACNDKRISKKFVLMNDDFFLLKPIEQIENWSRGTIQEMIEKHPTKGGYYYKSLVDTKNRMNAIGISDPIDFEIHGPMVFDKEKVLTTIGVMGMDKPFSIRSCYGNIAHLEPKKIMDFKAMNIAEFAYQMKFDREVLSISDGMVAEDDFRVWIERKYKNPSCFEMDEGVGSKTLPGRSGGVKRYYAVKTFTFNSKKINIGEIIDDDTIQGIKETKKMRGLWKYTQ